MSKSLQPKYRSRSPGQGICQVSTLRRSTLQDLMVVGPIVEEILKICQSHWSAKYRSRSPGHVTCQVSSSRRRTMQGLVVVCLIVEKIWNVNVNCVKVNGAQNIGQGYWVNIPAKSGGHVSCQVREMCHARYDGCCRTVVD